MVQSRWVYELDSVFGRRWLSNRADKGMPLLAMVAGPGNVQTLYF